VAGLLLAAGVPGDLFGAMLAPPGLPGAVPKSVRRAIAVGTTKALRVASPLVDAVLHHLPVNELTARLLQHTGFMLPGAKPADLAAAVRRFVQQDARWYTTLALALADVPEPDLRGIGCPVTVLAGRYDILADPVSAMAPFSALPQARTRLLSATHFLPLETPDVIIEELVALNNRVAAVEQARTALRPAHRPAQPLDVLIPPIPSQR
jgi:pimeloyl-ACP methyl ester carboxylesterase